MIQYRGFPAARFAKRPDRCFIIGWPPAPAAPGGVRAAVQIVRAAGDKFQEPSLRAPAPPVRRPASAGEESQGRMKPAKVQISRNCAGRMGGPERFSKEQVVRYPDFWAARFSAIKRPLA